MKPANSDTRIGGQPPTPPLAERPLRIFFFNVLPNVYPTRRPDKHGRVILVLGTMYKRTLKKSLFPRYQKHPAMYN